MDALIRAVVSVVEADTQLQALLGRPSGLIVAWGDLAAAENEVIAYMLVDAPVTGSDGDTRMATMQFSSFGRTKDRAWQMANRIEAMLTSAALWATADAVDAAPMRPHSRDAGMLEDATFKGKRVDTSIEFDAVRT